MTPKETSKKYAQLKCPRKAPLVRALSITRDHEEVFSMSAISGTQQLADSLSEQKGLPPNFLNISADTTECVQSIIIKGRVHQERSMYLRRARLRTVG